MERHSHADDMITLPNDSQSETQATSSSHLFIECPGTCKRRVAVESLNLAKNGRSRVIWNCSSCRLIKKKQMKISWYNLVCVQCTHTLGKTCLIQSCTSSCAAKRTLERKKNLKPATTKATPMSTVTSKRNQMTKKAKRFIQRLTKCELQERLRIFKAAWIQRNGEMPQPWFKIRGSKHDLIPRVHSAFEAFATNPSVPVPVGFQDALAKIFSCGNGKDGETKDWKDWKTQMFVRRGKRVVFKYKNEIYQDVANFCNSCEGLKNTYSWARADVMSTDFPKTAYLVVPGHSSNNYRHIPENWKNGAQDLSDVIGAAYILGQNTTPTGSHLLLVCQKELKRKAESALLSMCKQPGIAKSYTPRRRAERKQRSTSVTKTNC